MFDKLTRIMKSIIFITIDILIIKCYNSTERRVILFCLRNSTIRVDDK